MKVLIAEDDRINRRLLEVSLREWGYEVVVTTDGAQAWEALQADDAPSLVILDWMMPVLDGPEVCQRVRAAAEPRLTYIILLTARGQTQDVVAGLEAGADDYIVKPFDPPELRTRVGVGLRMLALQEKLVDRARELEGMQVRLAAQERFSQAVAQMSDAIITLDDQWRLASANRAACLLLDLPADEWRGLPLDEVLAPFAVSVPVADLRAGADHTTAFEISRPKTHPPLLMDARLTHVLDASGALQNVVLIVRDVTDERLPRDVQANFMTAVPHKLRTPLSLLLGYLALVKHLSPEELVQQWPRIADVWETELRSLIAMVQKLLDFERLTAQELAAELAETDVAAVASEAFAQVQAQYPDREAELALEIAPEAARVGCSADHLRLILRELMDNALKFADKQPARLTLRGGPAEAGWLRFAVTDNGPGIPHEYYDRVFEDFMQVEERVTGQVPGFGVGLRMVRHVVEVYGGTIAVTSQLGEGSTFTFTLPAVHSA